MGLVSTLEKLLSDRETDIAELAEVASVHATTIGRYLADENEPKLSVLRSWIRGLKSPVARAAIANMVCEGSDCLVVAGGASLDHNHDGKVDLLDALGATSDAIRGLSSELASLTSHIQAGGTPTTYRGEFTRASSDAISAIHVAQRVVQAAPVIAATHRKQAKREDAA